MEQVFIRLTVFLVVLCMSTVLLLAFAIARKMVQGDHETSTPLHDENKPALSSTDRSELFLERIRQTVTKLIRDGNCEVNRLAEELCISPSQLRRKTLAITGQTPKRYMMEIRMSMAREFMEAHPELSLNEVAQRSGFYDHSHFIRAFRSVYGVTPRELKGEKKGEG